MSGLINKETDQSALEVIEALGNTPKIEDAKKLMQLMQKVTGEEPKVWGKSGMIGFGKYSYTRKGSKEEFEWFPVGFAPRKSKTSVYLTTDVRKHEDLLNKLGKFSHGKGCLYLNKLADVDLDVLGELIKRSYESK